MSTMTKESGNPLSSLLDSYLEALRTGKPFSDTDFAGLKTAFDANREELHRHVCRVTPPRLVIDNTR